MDFLRAILAMLLFGAMLVAFVSLLFGGFWALATGRILLAVACFLILGVWGYLANRRRHPSHPEHFKDYGV